jgi:hypothetical protein
MSRDTLLTMSRPHPAHYEKHEPNSKSGGVMKPRGRALVVVAACPAQIIPASYVAAIDALRG